MACYTYMLDCNSEFTQHLAPFFSTKTKEYYGLFNVPYKFEN